MFETEGAALNTRDFAIKHAFQSLVAYSIELDSMSDVLSSFKASACPLRSQLNVVLLRPQRFASLVTHAATSHKVDKALSAAPGRSAIRKFENGLKDGSRLTAGHEATGSSNQAGIRLNRSNTSSDQKLRVAVDVDEGKLYNIFFKSIVKLQIIQFTY
jgi:hypothetical protein